MDNLLIHGTRSSSWFFIGLLVLVVSGLMSSQRALAADDAEIEEVVVTGYYIKKSAADSPSPLSVASRADIEEIGAMDIKDIVKSLTIVLAALAAQVPHFLPAIAPPVMPA